MAKMNETKRFAQLERMMKGAANRRRIQILHLLEATPGLDLSSIARACGMHAQTATEHTTKMLNAGLIQKERRAKYVLHELSPLGDGVLAFLKARPTQE